MDNDFFKKMRGAYKSYKESSEQVDLKKRLIENEKWFRMMQSDVNGKDSRIPATRSGFLFNAIITKHADAMDNLPDINILPREEGDKDTADVLTSVIPYILERCDFEGVYSDNWFSKLKTSSCYGVTWDPEANGMLGEIKVSKIDLLNLFWQPAISDTEDSEFVFYHSFMPAHEFKGKYGDAAYALAERISHVDTYYTKDFSFANETILVVDCYYKVIKKGKKTKLHFAKFSGEYLIYSSENEKGEDGNLLYPDGYYKHGMYPFFFDFVYPAEQSVAGFGVADVLRPLQSYIDSLDSLIQVNNRLVGKPRWIVNTNSGINVDDLADLDREIIESEMNDISRYIHKLEVSALPQQVMNTRDARIMELKEIIGNRDFQQGGTANGVTSGTGLSVLQSVGDKISRDIIKTSYRSYKKIILCMIELIRQFYTVERTIRITGKDGDYKFVKFDNSGLISRGGSLSGGIPHQSPAVTAERSVEDVGPYNTGVKDFDLGAAPDAPVGIDLPMMGEGAEDVGDFLGMGEEDVPYFDVKLSVQKSNPYSRELSNQTILELADKGLLNLETWEQNLPVLRALQFDGKDELIKELSDARDKMMQAQAEAQAQAQAEAQAMMNVGDRTVVDAGPYDGNVTGSGAPIGSDGQEMVDITEMLNQ